MVCYDRIAEDHSIMKQIDIFGGLIEDFKSKALNYVTNSAFTSRAPKPTLWDEIEVKEDYFWFLPYTKECSVRIEKVYLKLIFFQSVSQKKLENLFRLKTNAQGKTLKSRKKMKHNHKLKSIQTIPKNKKKKKKLKKNTKNVQTKHGKIKRSAKEFCDDINDATYNLKYSYLRRRKSIQNKNQIESKLSIIHTSPLPILKSILIDKTKIQNNDKLITKSHRKVSFCTSIFIRNFKVDSESDEDSS